MSIQKSVDRCFGVINTILPLLCTTPPVKHTKKRHKTVNKAAIPVKQPIPTHPTLPRHPLSDESNNKWHTTEYDTQTKPPMCDTGGITPRIQRKHAPPTPWEAQTRNRRAHHTTDRPRAAKAQRIAHPAWICKRHTHADVPHSDYKLFIIDGG